MLVSIVIPAYNAEAFVERAIRSALAAGDRLRGNWEIIVVDNCSTDNTASALARISTDFPTAVKVIRCDRPGAPAARNEGTRMSTGEWIQYLDADDTFHPDKIAGQVDMAGTAEWVVGGYRHLYTDGRTEDSVPHPDLWKGLFHDFRTGCTHSNLVRRSAIQKIGGWREDISSGQDTDLYFRLLRADVPTVIDERILSFYHHHDSATRITAGSSAEKFQLRLDLLTAASSHLQQTRSEYWKANQAYFLGAILRVIRQLATYDLNAATEAYHMHFTPYTPQQLEIVGRYTRLYPYLGFRNVERLRLALAGVIPEDLKRILKS